MSQYDEHPTANHVKPQVGNLSEKKAGQYDQLCDDGCYKGGVSANPFETESYYENSQDRSIKKRTQNIHRLDERSETVGEQCKTDGVDPPENRS